MNEERTNGTAGGRARRRRLMATGATALALVATVATADTASADAEAPVQGTPAPGWQGPQVEERCVVFGPGHGPVIFEHRGEEPEDVEVGAVELEDGEHRRVDHFVPAPGDTVPGWVGPGPDLRRAPGPGCDEHPTPGPHPGPWPVVRER